MNARDYAEGLSDAVRRQWSFQVKNWGKRHVYPQLPNYVQVTPAASKEFQQPEMSLIENAMFQSNPDLDDHEWRKQFFGDMPHYLSRYFAERYNKIFKQKGRSAANLYLLKTVGKDINPRLQKVLDQYRRQFKFRNAYVRSNDLSREKLLAEMDKSEIKKLSQQFADFFAGKLEPLIESEKANHKDYANVIVAVFESLQDECRSFGYTPPYNRNDGLHQSEAECGILRLVCQRAWENKLNTKRMTMREHLAIAVGQVQKAASPYCSRDCMHEWKNQKQRNRDFIKGMSIFDEDSGEEIALYDMFYKSTANPAIRRCELMVRMAGYQSIATAMGCDGLFLTLTAPSKYHNTRKKGGFVDQWLGNSPKDAQRYLCKVWARIRAQLKREELPVFGMRVAEPHHDGTPHWHLLMFMQPEHVDRIREIFIGYAIDEEITELCPKVYRKPIVGPLDYRPRCDVKMMDPSKGTATGYIAKYISKNIDGYGMKGELDDETGRDQREMAAHVTAWASRWRIRQFQPIGGAPVTTYRELRRYANNDKNAFKSFVTTLSSKQQNNLFNELFPDQNPIFMGPQLNFHGPRLNYEAMNSLQRWEVITDKYKPELKTNAAAASDAMKAADKGDFAAYVMAQGGPFVSRKDLLIRNDYDTNEMGNEYGEFVSKIQGFHVVGDEAVKTRIRKWTIQPKSQALLDSEASTSSTEGAEVLNWPEGSSRSSVTNCTPSRRDRLNTGIKALLKRRGIHLDDHLVNVMGQGAQIRVDKDHIVKLRQGYYVENQYHPPELVDVKPEKTNIWDGWNSPETEIKDTSHYIPGWEDWESWDWG
ncbi:Putative phage gene [Moritella viscosa]|uniref:replication endonuclease n=1 Tax=Moritella viscosa TaxID=80854 RepID=UPI000508E7DE|nr:replication endonuclease [Moritella viscosa]CED59242.1 phage replication protein [Moritella viscosa]SHO00623.1 Putative phage gene [Moritella viscosa]SHO20320.1 Putative phage gene [Moritella viscosa]